MPAGLNSSAIGFAAADSVGPWMVMPTRMPRMLPSTLQRIKKVMFAARRRHALWTRACRKQLGRQQKLHGKGTM